MTHANQDPNKPHLNIGTIGHLGHGKTTLTAALSALFCKRYGGQPKDFAHIVNAPQERERGLTMNASRVEYTSSSCRYTHIDCPEQVDCIKGMITGAFPKDGAILVVSAVDGVVPQTREHVEVARQAHVPHIVVFMNKCDLVDDEKELARVELQIRELLSEYGFPGNTLPVIQGSARLALEGESFHEQKLVDLVTALDSTLTEDAESGSTTPYTVFEARIYMFTKAEGGRRQPFFDSYCPQYHFRNKRFSGTLKLPDGVDMVLPGATEKMTVTLASPVATDEGSHFAILENSCAVGVGVVAKVIA